MAISQLFDFSAGIGGFLFDGYFIKDILQTYNFKKKRIYKTTINTT